MCLMSLWARQRPGSFKRGEGTCNSRNLAVLPPAQFCIRVAVAGFASHHLG